MNTHHTEALVTADIKFDRVLRADAIKDLADELFAALRAVLVNYGMTPKAMTVTVEEIDELNS